MVPIPETNNLHVAHTQPLIPPAVLKRRLPLSDSSAANIDAARTAIKRILRGDDNRPLVIVGPCSIHDPAAARAYAAKLKDLADELNDELLIVMRVYFEKPRTTTGWKGLINDPHLDGSYAIEDGLSLARHLLLDLADMDMPTATEFLDPIVPQYIADLVSWTAIGARTTESQTHRQLASGLSMPVGFKNGTDGGLTVALNAMVSAASPHHFLGIDDEGRVSMVQTEGNPDCHVVLRGGSSGPNYEAEAVQAAAARLAEAGARARLLIDCSHGNSAKQHDRQPLVLEAVGEQLASGSPYILGAMLESNLVAGRQDLGGELTYGCSITDACIDFDTTAASLRRLAAQVTDVRHHPVT